MTEEQKTQAPKSHVVGNALLDRLDAAIDRNVALDVAQMSPEMRQRYRAALASEGQA